MENHNNNNNNTSTNNKSMFINANIRKPYHTIFKTILQMLQKARDFYITSMNYCDGQVSLTTYIPSTTIPRSFSVRKVDSYSGCEVKDCREIIRAASNRGRLVRVDVGNKVRIVKQLCKMPVRSCSVRPEGVYRIDEVCEVEFGEESLSLCRRSRSCAVQRTVIV